MKTLDLINGFFFFLIFPPYIPLFLLVLNHFVSFINKTNKGIINSTFEGGKKDWEQSKIVVKLESFPELNPRKIGKGSNNKLAI